MNHGRIHATRAAGLTVLALGLASTAWAGACAGVDGDIFDVGSPSIVADTCGQVNDWGTLSVPPFTVTCAGGQNSADLAYAFVAPYSGPYTFDTEGSGYDTAIQVRDYADCGVTQLACDDDGGTGALSTTTVNMVQGQAVIVVINGYGGTGCGVTTLNISGCAAADADTDGDTFCDAIDLCSGDDATGDSDGDGTCDDTDLCFGDDTTGDTDSDGVCDSDDVCPNDPGGDDDADGICDAFDLCFGDDASGDTDADGVCDDLDLCVGDDASGDNDGDGLCNDTDTTCDNYDGDLGSAVGSAVITGTTCGAVDDFYPSCAFNGNSTADDLAYTFTAAGGGTYVFDLSLSGYDTVLAVRDPADCGQTESACDDDGGTGTRSLVTTTLAAGQTVVLDIDGYAAGCGAFQLDISGCSNGDDADADGICDEQDLCTGDDATGDTDGDGICDDSDLCVGDDASGDNDFDGLCNDTDTVCDNFPDFTAEGVGTDLVTGSTCGAGNDFGNTTPYLVTCASAQNPADVSILWTAPADGDFTINTDLSTFDTALTLRDTADCGLTQLACDDDGGEGTRSQIVLTGVTAGDEFLFVVDAFGSGTTACGDFKFNVIGCASNDDADADGVCDSLDVCIGDDATGDADGDGTCDNLDACFGDDTTGDTDGDGVCDDSDICPNDPGGDDDADGICDFVDLCFGDNATGDTDADGVCDDNDICVGDDASGDDDGDGLCNDTDTTCDNYDGDLGSAVGSAVIAGTTCGAVNDFFPSCAFNGDSTADDLAYTFTAAGGGVYTFDLSLSGYDTVLSVRDPADCGQTETACDDDGGTGTRSLVTTTLAAGQTVVLTIDGYAASCGNFQLDISGCSNGDDADADGTCDEQDLCFGDDTTGDTDADGVCDSDDACVGDDASGDFDGDGLCNDTDTTCDNYDGDLGSVTGAQVSVGDTCGAGDDAYPSCAFNGLSTADDLLFTWTAPADGDYIFSLANSGYDTVLALRDPADCGTTENECNDDTVGLLSEVVASLVTGQVVVIQIDGYNLACGDYELDITPVTACEDIDADGVCDDVELCYGNDIGGDADFDGMCEPFLQVGPVAAGASLDLALLGGPPGTQAVWLASTRGSSGGTQCVPAFGVCTDLVTPTVVGRSTFDPTGFAAITVTVPSGIPSGRFVGFQGAFLDLVRSVGETSQVVVRRVQ